MIGVIHNPFTKKTVWGWSGKAVSEPLVLNKKVPKLPLENLNKYIQKMMLKELLICISFTIHLYYYSKEDEVKHPVVIVSRSHSGDVKNIAKDVFGENSNVILAGGAGNKYTEYLKLKTFQI